MKISFSINGKFEFWATQLVPEIVHVDWIELRFKKYQNILESSFVSKKKIKNVIKKAESNNKMTERSAQGSSRSRRGHQNHPKNVGIRTSNVPTSEIIKALREGRNLETLFHQQQQPPADAHLPVTSSNDNRRLTETCDESNKDLDNISCNISKRNSSSSSLNSIPSEKSEKKSHHRSTDGKKKRIKTGQVVSKINRPAADGAEDATDEDDAETVELSKLRCTSERTELVAERENRRQKKCADYPGLAFGRSIFSSDSMMKFNIIRNELQNIMNNQLRRVRRKHSQSHDSIVRCATVMMMVSLKSNEPFKF